MNRRSKTICRRFRSTNSNDRTLGGKLAMLALCCVCAVGCSAANGTRLAHRQAQPVQAGIEDDYHSVQSKQDASALIQEAIEQYRNGQLKQARASLIAARRLDPRRVTTYQMEAQIAFDSGDRNGYLDALHSIVAAHPRSARMNHAAGILLVEAGRTDGGLAALERAVQYDPRNIQYIKDLAAAQLQQDPEGATELLERVVAANPRDSSLHLALANIYEVEEKWPSAVTHYDRLLTGDPNHLRWRQHRAGCLYRAGRFALAADDYAKCDELDASLLSDTECTEWADACLQSNEFDPAEVVLNMIAGRSSVPPKELELLRGICALRRGDRSRSQDIIATALEHWPGDGELQQVLQLADTTAAIDPTDDAADVGIGQ